MKITKIIFIFAVIYCTAFTASARQLPETIIRIEIKADVPGFNLGSEGEFYLYKLSSGDMDKLSGSGINYVKADGPAITFDGMYADPHSVRLVPVKDNEWLRIDGKRYKDTIIIKKTGLKKLTVINELGLENYIAGILPCEVDPEWPIEALKAQSVISRTYAMINLKRHLNEECNFCSKVHCQVYGGADGEKKKTNRAVELTRGEVLTYSGKLAQTVYHAACAGHTENPSNVWKWEIAAPEYLKGVRDKYCKGNKHQNWTKDVEISYLVKKMNVEGYKQIKDIVSIKFIDRTKSGRAKNVKIKYENENGENHAITLSAGAFRMMVSPWILKSTFVSDVQKIKKGVFRFAGHGWGHGVGLCQWGAKAMADNGFGYKAILKFYYPGTKLEKWED